MIDHALTADAWTDQLVADIERLVRCESPSDDLAAVARSADVVAALGAERLGTDPERIVIEGRTHLRWRFGRRTRVLVLGHHDTVWPLGSLASHPFSVRDGVMRGPGCFDMLGGVAMAFHAVRTLVDRDGVTLLITGDEEIGSPTSRALIEAEARGCDAALVLEAAGPDGALKTERKGVSYYEVTVTGRAAHAGLEPELGINAGLEAAHQMTVIAALGDPGLGTTVTPTRVEAGTTANTVPACARFSVDVRAREEGEQRRVHEAISALCPHHVGARLAVDGGPNRPPLSGDASAELFAHAAALANRMGIGPLSEVAVGGASDGNFTAGVGVPTLDGLGAVGGGAHADHEHLVVAELPRRTRLVAALIGELLANIGGAS